MSEAIPRELTAALERSAAARGRVGATIHYFSELPSTSDEAARLAEGGAAEGTTVIASSQTAGRGRLGRTWFSPPGAGLYVSVICRDAGAAPYLSLAGGVAVADGILAATRLPVEIKWPNDIVIDGGFGRRRKVAGILAEASSAPEGVQHVVLGFGINLLTAAYPPEIADRATSLETELGREVQPGTVLAATFVALRQCLDQLAAGNSAQVLARWRVLSPSASGATVEWHTETGTHGGKTAGIEEDGALRVMVNGVPERIISGTVRWL